MRLSAGDKLGPYEITGLIGRGGMGEVYRGTDTRLNRPVAIKVSSKEFNDRFEREARAISALNHPHICTLYDVGPNYLVMEFVEGELLSKLIERGPLPLDKALAYSIQIADALAAAHAKGVIHRDLKPGNIIITRNGAKVLDFGLARLTMNNMSSESIANMETLKEPLTNEGALLGTIFYMAPEQVEGKEADERSDIFAFGAVMYEMVTGQRAFAGDTSAGIIAAILRDQTPPMSQRQAGVPRAFERVVRRCVEKKPEDRWHSARDLKPALELIDLETQPVSAASASVTAPLPVQAKKRWLWPVVGVAAVAVLAAGAWTLRPKPAPAPALKFQVILPENVRFSEFISVSPDGHKMVFTATGEQSGLWIHDLDMLDWRKLNGTENAVAPFWSPDSRFIAFAAGTELKKVEAAGGLPQTLCTSPTPVGSGSWSKDGIIVFGGRGRGPLQRVAASGGVPSVLTTVDTARGETFHTVPTFLPDGKHFIYYRSSGNVASDAVTGTYIGALDAKPEEQSRERLLANPFASRYAGGNLFFMREGTLMVQPFDAGKLQPTGEPVPLAERVSTTGATGAFSASEGTVLAYKTGANNSAQGNQITWLDRDGKATGTFGQPGTDQGLRLSPDGTRAATRDAPLISRGDIWLLDFTRGVRTRFTFRQTPGSPAVWSPDGGRIAFAAGTLFDTIYEKAASGAGEEKELFKKANETKRPTSWSRDGRFLLYNASAPKTRADLWLLPLEGERKPSLLLGTDFNEASAVFSPDGRWLAYISDESGGNQLYVRPFVASGSAGPLLGEGKWQVSKDGAFQAPPSWRNDGKEIIFLAPGGRVMAVDVNGGGAGFQLGTPHPLFTAPPGTSSADVTADGKRFLVSVPPGGGQAQAQSAITVVANWQAELKR